MFSKAAVLVVAGVPSSAAAQPAPPPEPEIVVTGRALPAPLGDAAYDVVLLDIWLPDRDGLDTLADIRQLPPDRIPEVVIISGHGTIEAAVRAGDAAEARRLNGRLKPLWDLFTEFSSLRVMYAAVNLLGLCAAAPPRPILPLPEAAQRRVGQVLAALDLA